MRSDHRCPSALAVLVMVVALAACSTLPPPADLVTYERRAKDKDAMKQAAHAAPKAFKQSQAYHAYARTACEDNEAVGCSHFSTLAKIKLDTAMEAALLKREYQRAADAEAKRAAASRDEAVLVAELADARRRIARMERLKGLKAKLASAASSMERAQAASALEQARSRTKEQELAQAQQQLQQQQKNQQQEIEAFKERERLVEAAAKIVGTKWVRRNKRSVTVVLYDLYPPRATTVGASKRPLLARIAALINSFPTRNVLIEGYTDSGGSAQTNLQLSQSRANDVRDLLFKSDVPLARMTATGYGEVNPISDNATRKGRRINRRIEVVFVF